TETRCRDAPETPDPRPVLRACATSGRGPRISGRYGWQARRRGPPTLIPDPSSLIPGRSSVTRGAARELLNLVLLDQSLADLGLIRRRDVVDAKHRFARAHVALGAAMAVEAPFHLQRFLLPHQRHPVHLSVTSGAAHPFVHMDAVIEVHEVGEIVDAVPLERAAGAEALADWLEERAVRENLWVAVHPRPRRRDDGE